MTISSEVRTAGPFVGNDATTAFPFYFKVFTTADVLAVREEDGIETELVLDTDYTIVLNEDQSATPGGTLTTGVALATGQTLTLTSVVAYLQPVDLTNQGGFYPNVINSALDRLTILIQQLFERLGRTLKFPISDGAVQDLPGRVARAGAVLAFDEVDGEPVVGPDIASVGTVAGNVTAINTVAANIADVNTVATNVADVTNFADVYYGPLAADPTLRNDGSAMIVGDMYFSTTFDSLRIYDGATWVDPSSGSITTETFTGDGVVVDFALASSPGSKNNTQVYLSGVYQAKSEYEITGAGFNVVTFDTAPGLGIPIEVVTLAPLPMSPLTADELAELHTLVAPSTALQLPVGTTAARPTPAAGMVRRNSTTGLLEGYGSAWGSIFTGENTRLAYGVTASAWGAAYSTITIGLSDFFATATNFVGLCNNLYFDGTNWRFKSTSSAGNLGMLGNTLNYTIASGSAGAVATLVSTLGVDSSGNVIQANPAGTLGYGPGAGGTVTQATSKATGVALNKPCGQITTHAASLAANTAVSFTFTNTLIAATDNVTINIASGAATGGTYVVQVDAVSAGSCRVSLRNLTGGALAEALVLTFQIHKAVTA